MRITYYLCYSFSKIEFPLQNANTCLEQDYHALPDHKHTHIHLLEGQSRLALTLTLPGSTLLRFYLSLWRKYKWSFRWQYVVVKHLSGMKSCNFCWFQMRVFLLQMHYWAHLSCFTLSSCAIKYWKFLAFSYFWRSICYLLSCQWFYYLILQSLSIISDSIVYCHKKKYVVCCKKIKC